MNPKCSPTWCRTGLLIRTRFFRMTFFNFFMESVSNFPKFVGKTNNSCAVQGTLKNEAFFSCRIINVHVSTAPEMHPQSRPTIPPISINIACNIYKNTALQATCFASPSNTYFFLAFSSAKKSKISQHQQHTIPIIGTNRF